MSDIAESLLSPSWWVSVVVVSFLVNLLSAYAKPKLDRLMSGMSTARQQKAGKAAAKRRVQVQQVRESSDLQIILLLDEIRSTLNFLFGYGGAIGLLVLAARYVTGWERVVVMIFVLLAMLVALTQQSRAAGISSILLDAGVRPWENLRDTRTRLDAEQG